MDSLIQGKIYTKKKLEQRPLILVKLSFTEFKTKFQKEVSIQKKSFKSILQNYATVTSYNKSELTPCIDFLDT